MKKYASLILVAPLIVAMGCGSSRPSAKLSGKVTFEGKPATYGQILVTSEDGKHSGKGEIDENGNYEVKNSPIGKVKIQVLARDPGGAGGGSETEIGKKDGGKDVGIVKGMPDASKATDLAGKAKEAAAQKTDPVAMQKRWLTIKDLSPKYSDINSTPISTTVEAGGSTYDIKLNKAGT